MIHAYKIHVIGVHLTGVHLILRVYLTDVHFYKRTPHRTFILQACVLIGVRPTEMYRANIEVLEALEIYRRR